MNSLSVVTQMLSNALVRDPLNYEHIVPNDTAYKCASRGIKRLNLNHCPNLEILICQDNDIEELDCSKCPQLKLIQCSNNKIVFINILHCSNLEAVYCRNNKIEYLNCSGCNNLFAIDCSDNEIVDLNLPIDNKFNVNCSRVSCRNNPFLQNYDFPEINDRNVQQYIEEYNRRLDYVLK
jgi:Leucine-rich repeat (LRR) protein